MATILVVDDDPVVQRMIVYVLEEEGYAAERASNALEALEYLNEESCDLMICDVKMPDMDGLELLEQVRRDKDHSKLPVIMLTARPRVYDAADITDNTRTAFLTKPISSDDLIAAVARQLE